MFLAKHRHAHWETSQHRDRVFNAGNSLNQSKIGISMLFAFLRRGEC